MSSRTRSERRHHRDRILAKRYRQDSQWYLVVTNVAEWRFKHARKRLNTGCLCSCRMCGNPRRYYGNSAAARTFKELIPWE